MKHSSVTIGAPKEILFLGGMGIVSWNVVHMGTVAPDFSGYRADISPNQPGDLSITSAVHIIFSYTTPLFYAKMMIVHTVPSLWFSCVVTLFYQGSV